MTLLAQNGLARGGAGQSALSRRLIGPRRLVSTSARSSPIGAMTLSSLLLLAPRKTASTLCFIIVWTLQPQASAQAKTDLRDSAKVQLCRQQH